MIFTRTKEQQNIVDLAKQGNNLVVKAFAGAAKTTTLVEVAKEIKKPSLYIAFNKSIADEAASKFPSNVECRTIHSLAYRDIINYKFKKKLQGFYSFDDVIKDDVINNTTGAIKADLKKLRVEVVEVIKAFSQSASYSLEDFVKADYPNIDKKYILEYWKNMCDEDRPCKITPDTYLKLFQLRKHILPYDVIYLDEAQDSSPVILSIILNQQAQIILVGDEYQAIYEWRGAINAMARVGDSFKETYLTQSFRFTQDIADKATKLTSILGNTRNIIGTAVEPLDWNKKNAAVLVRTNNSFLTLLLEAEAEGKKVFIIGDLKELWSKMYHISALLFKEPVKYPNKELSQYRTYVELYEASEDMPNLARLIKLTRTLGDGGLTKNINRIKSVIVDRPEQADYTITTVHKAKGLEWNEVTLHDDIFYQKEGFSDIELLLTGQTLELLYVAVTRAKYKVILPAIIEEVIHCSDKLKHEAEEIRIGVGL